MNNRKTTLVLTGEPFPTADWHNAKAADSRIIAIENPGLLREAIHLAQTGIDVHLLRVIIDQSIGAEEWLELLTELPQTFRGDVLWISPAGHAFLSATGRSDERVLYKLSAADVGFYLEVSGISMPVHTFLHGSEEPQFNLEALVM